MISLKGYWHKVYSSKMDVPDFILNEEDSYFLALSLDRSHDHSKSVKGEHEWRLKRFDWSPFTEKDVEHLK